MARSVSEDSLDIAIFKKIKTRYLLAFAAITIIVICAQVLIQLHLNTQLSDSKVINIAGRQRALSQKLVKEILLLKDTYPSTSSVERLQDIKETAQLWKTSHNALRYGDKVLEIPVETNDTIIQLFNNLDKEFNQMTQAVTLLEQHNQLTPQTIKQVSQTLVKNEQTFLQKMDGIVNTYDVISSQKVRNLKQIEYLLFGVILLLMILEIVLLFRPLSIQIKKIIARLLKSNVKAEANTSKVERLLVEKEKTLQELQELNYVIDTTALFASTRQDGSIVFISKKFKELLGVSEKDISKPLVDVLTTNQGQQQYLKEILNSKRKNVIRTEEIKITTLKGEKRWLDMSIVPMTHSSRNQTILILCSDITERKDTIEKVEKLTKQQFEQQIQQKKIQASQIVEGQEEERKRIAKDIHDGIGQMLTALKFNIESINLDDTTKSLEKIEYLKTLTVDLIKGVRSATFNLTPPELSDHGIFPAIQKMTSELSRLTKQNILYENNDSIQLRLDSLAETNMYRVTQEAVNNAIKYAHANYILVSVKYAHPILSIIIDDDGKGFDPEKLLKNPIKKGDGGMGLHYMRERMSYINGRLFISSEKEKGSRITINYTIPEE